VTMQSAPGPKRWENFCVALWQRDVLWWPLVFLRPAPQNEASAVLVLGLSLAGTLLASALVVLLCRVMLVPMPLLRFGVGIGICFVLVVCLLGFTFALPWNRRARRLRGH